MVDISKIISRKIKEQKGEISEDETVQFKSYLLSLGINDPVTRETHGTGLKYYRELAREVAKVIEKPLQVIFSEFYLLSLSSDVSFFFRRVGE